MEENVSAPSRRALTGMEALLGFLGWLTSRDLPVTFSARHDATLAIELLKQFTAVNPCGDVAADWPACYTTPQRTMTTNTEDESFQTALTRLLNGYSLERGSDTPDFLLAEYLVQCLAVWDTTIVQRERWYGRSVTSPAVREDVARRQEDVGCSPSCC